MSLPCFPRTVPRSGIRFPPQGPGEQFPCFLGTIRCSDSLTSLPPRFVSFVWRYHARRGGFVSPGRSHGRTVRPGVFVAGSPFRLLRVETTGPPRFLGNPGVSMPRSSTPVGPADPADQRYADAAFRVNDIVGSHNYKPFGALSRGLPTRCLRFAARVTPQPRKTRFRRSANLAGQDWLPAGFHCKV